MGSHLMGKNSKWFTENCAEDIDFLKAHETVKEGGKRHKPILPSMILEKFRDRAKTLGLILEKENMALSKDGCKVMYVADIGGMNGDGYSLSCGFRNSTDMTRGFSGVMGTNVWICSNGCCSGLIVPSKQRNTTHNFDLIGDKIDRIFNRFIEDKDVIHGQIDLMRHTKLTDDIIGKFVRSIVRSGEIGNSHLCDILREIDKPTLNSSEDDSCFRLLNAGTYVTTHDIKNPIQGSMASRLINNTIMNIIKDGFTPLGDDVIEVESEVVAE